MIRRQIIFMVPPIVRDFVAGEDKYEALEYVEEMSNNVKPIVNYLGEHYTEKEKADSDKEEYCSLIEESQLEDFCISVKPTQLGLEISHNLFEENLLEILKVAEKNDVFVWLDMEDSDTTEETINTYKKYVKDYSIGICLQANLKRTKSDIEDLSKGKIRLVKGGYDENNNIAYTSKSDIDDSYRDCLEKLFKSNLEIAIGTHDESLWEDASYLSTKYEKDYEIQMLMGLKEKDQIRISKETDTEVYRYIPYGPNWKSYFYRRVKEKKGNLLFMSKSVYEVVKKNIKEYFN